MSYLEQNLSSTPAGYIWLRDMRVVSVREVVVPVVPGVPGVSGVSVSGGTYVPVPPPPDAITTPSGIVEFVPMIIFNTAELVSSPSVAFIE